jgi:hypothetical protein
MRSALYRERRFLLNFCKVQSEMVFRLHFSIFEQKRKRGVPYTPPPPPNEKPSHRFPSIIRMFYPPPSKKKNITNVIENNYNFECFLYTL